MSDIAAGYTFVDGEKGITASKLNNIVAGAVIQPSFVTGQPASSTLDPTDNLLEVKSGGTYARITGSQLISSVGSQVDVTSQITALRLRSFSAIGNGTFECDQRTAFTGVSNSGWALDRWSLSRTGTMTGTAIGTPGVVQVPNTSFDITQSFLRVTLTGQEVSLGAADFWVLQQAVEGPVMRELYDDVHSLALLVRSSVATLKFGVALRDGAATTSRSLTKLVTLGAANTWTLISLASIPSFHSTTPTTAWSLAPGTAGYFLNITLACGTTYTSAANDVWQTGNFLGATGQSNFAAQAVNSTLDIAFVQHSPGSNTDLMDLSFGQNLDGPFGCLRYYAKSYPYGTKAGTSSVAAGLQPCIPATPASGGTTSSVLLVNGIFPKVMAKAPTVVSYGYTGVTNAVTAAGGSDSSVTSVGQIGDRAFGVYSLSAAVPINVNFNGHWTA